MYYLAVKTYPLRYAEVNERVGSTTPQVSGAGVVSVKRESGESTEKIAREFLAHNPSPVR